MKDLIKFIEEVLLDAISPTGQDLNLIMKCSASLLLLETVLEFLHLPHLISFSGALLAFILFSILVLIKKNRAIEFNNLYSTAKETATKLKSKLKELDDDISS